MPNGTPDIFESTDAVAGTSTIYQLGIGQSGQGASSSLGDHDWYAISVVAGQTYAIAAIGTGTNALVDTYLNLRNSAGTIVATNDDSGPSLSSQLTFTATYTGVYYIDAGAYGDSSTGEYGISVTQGQHASFDILMGVGALDGHSTWSSRGTGVTITYGWRAEA